MNIQQIAIIFLGIASGTAFCSQPVPPVQVILGIAALVQINHHDDTQITVERTARKKQSRTAYFKTSQGKQPKILCRKNKYKPAKR